MVSVVVTVMMVTEAAIELHFPFALALALAYLDGRLCAGGEKTLHRNEFRHL